MADDSHAATAEDVRAVVREFLPILSHDVRTPMTAIKGAAGVLAAAMSGEFSEQATKLVEICQRNADLATLLVQDVVDILRLRVGGAEVSAAKFDAIAEARETWNEVSRRTSLQVAITSDAENAPLVTTRHYYRRAVSALIRFPQSRPGVSRQELGIIPRRDEVEMSLAFGPADIGVEEIAAFMVTPTRGVRPQDGRLPATGLEMSLLDALSSAFHTTFDVFEHPPDGIRLRLVWPSGG